VALLFLLKSPNKSDIPIIVLTPSVLENTEKKCLEVGFNELLTIPNDIILSVSLIDRYIRPELMTISTNTGL